jgi:lipopolysaccharide transport system permease protein
MAVGMGVLWDRRAVIWAMAIASVRARYQRTALGMAWSVLGPALMALLIGVVYAKLMNRDVYEYAPFLFGGFFTWMFISHVVGGGANALTGSAGYVRQTTLPLAVYPMKHTLAGFLHFMFALIAIMLILIAMGRFHPGALYAIWPGVLLILVFGASVCQLQAVIGTLFRDYDQLSSVVIRALFFITPVFYPPDLMTAHGRELIFEWNPLHYLLTCVREPILTGEFPAGSDILIASLISLATAVLGHHLFTRYEKRLYALM